MYLLTIGSIVYCQEDSLTMHEASESTDVLPGTWLCEVAMWCQWMHSGSATVDTACELLSISVDKFGEVMHADSIFQGIVCEYCKQYHRKVIAAYPPQSQ